MTVCKYVFDEAGAQYPDDADLAKLRALAAEQLNLAPHQHQEGVFKAILGNCQAVGEQPRSDPEPGWGCPWSGPQARETEGSPCRTRRQSGGHHGRVFGGDMERAQRGCRNLDDQNIQVMAQPAVDVGDPHEAGDG
jgi:hypothetical protein